MNLLTELSNHNWNLVALTMKTFTVLYLKLNDDLIIYIKVLEIKWRTYFQISTLFITCYFQWWKFWIVLVLYSTTQRFINSIFLAKMLRCKLGGKFICHWNNLEFQTRPSERPFKRKNQKLWKYQIFKSILQFLLHNSRSFNMSKMCSPLHFSKHDISIRCNSCSVHAKQDLHHFYFY